MSQITYSEAEETILELTQDGYGYTQKSQDRLWTCFMYEREPSTSRLFFTTRPRLLSYDLCGDVLFWTSAAEARAAQKRLARQYPGEVVYVINWGDDSRWEKALLYSGVFLDRGKFETSAPALRAMSRACESSQRSVQA